MQTRSLLLVSLLTTAISPNLVADTFIRAATAVSAEYVVQLSAGTPRVWKAAHKVEGEYIVVLKDMPAAQVASVARQLANGHAGEVIATLTHGFKGFGVRLTEQQAMRLAAHPLVDRIEENGYLVPAQTSPQQFVNDDYWYLDRIDQYTPLDTTRQYSFGSTGSNVNVYVLDSGILSTHEEFTPGQVLEGIRYTNETSEFSATNPCAGFADNLNGSHGTAVASVIGGRMAGVAKGVTLIPVKVMGCNGSSTILHACWGLDWILQHQRTTGRRSIVNYSFVAVLPVADINSQCEVPGGPRTECVPALENNFANVVAANVPVVVSAGNQGNSHPQWAGFQPNARECQVSPARMGYGGSFATIHRTITVGGTNEQDTRWARLPGEEIPQCVAPNCYDVGSNWGSCVSIWAPAQHFRRLAHINGNNSYRTVVWSQSGTSFAAPVVTGMIARLLQRYPTLSAVQAWEYIRDNANTTRGDLDPGPTFNPRLAYISPFD